MRASTKMRDETMTGSVGKLAAGYLKAPRGWKDARVGKPEGSNGLQKNSSCQSGGLAVMPQIAVYFYRR